MDEFNKLIELVKILRKKCPWDKEQTLESIRGNIIEEAYELVNAINENDADKIKEELGDLLWQYIFATNIACETKKICFKDTMEFLYNKLIEHHPHVFNKSESLKFKTAKDVKTAWEEFRVRKKKKLLDSIPPNLPALKRIEKLSYRAKSIGLDWKDYKDVLKKLDEEISELKEAINNEQKKESIINEIGDVLFVLANLARHLNIDLEIAAHSSAEKFIKRFNKLVKLIDINKSYDIEYLDKLWEKVKSKKDKQ